MKKLHNKQLEEKMVKYAKLFDKPFLLISLTRKLYGKNQLEKYLFNRDDFYNIGSFLIQQKDITSFWNEQDRVFDYEVFKEKAINICSKESFLKFKEKFENEKYNNIVERSESEEDFKEKLNEILNNVSKENLSLIYSELKQATKSSMKLITPLKIYSLLKSENKDISHKELVKLCQLRTDLNINKNTFTMDNIKKEMEQ